MKAFQTMVTDEVACKFMARCAELGCSPYAVMSQMIYELVGVSDGSPKARKRRSTAAKGASTPGFVAERSP